MDGDIRRALAGAVAAEMEQLGPVVHWGFDDCAMFAANPIHRVLGYDPAAEWRGHYRSRNGAQRVLGKMGLAFALRRAASAHGWRRIDPAQARSGDPGLLRIDRTLTTAICRTPGWFVMRSDEGYVALRADKINLAWSLG